MDQTDYQELVRETAKLLPLSPAEEVNAVASAAVALLAMQSFDWKAVRAFLEIRENRDRVLAMLRGGQLLAAAGRPGSP